VILIPIGVGGLVWLLFGGLALVRREKFPAQLTLETAGLTLAWLGLAIFLDYANPIAQFVVTYLVVMRSRILIDFANTLARRGRGILGLQLIDLAERLGADDQTRFIATINRSVIFIRGQKMQEAAAMLERALARKPEGLHPKFEAVCRFNLAVAYEKGGKQKEALAEYRRVLTLAPASIQGRGARAAIKRAMGGHEKR
jgi:tetratricopeptide (TPR) repeat protein